MMPIPGIRFGGIHFDTCFLTTYVKERRISFMAVNYDTASKLVDFPSY
jgi:hypothetical protein